MTMKPDGNGECDRCGADIGNAGVDRAVVVGDLDPDMPGHVRNLHFCRENGCDKKVLSARNLEHHDARQAKEKAAEEAAAKKAAKKPAAETTKKTAKKGK